VAVRIRMKKMGRAHRPFYRVCAMDRHAPRDGRVLEELGVYDPSIADTNARAVLDKERIDYWLSVGAQPSDKMSVLIKKYGTDGTHLEQQQAALQKLAEPRIMPDPGAPASLPKKKEVAATAGSSKSDSSGSQKGGSQKGAPSEQAGADGAEAKQESSSSEPGTSGAKEKAEVVEAGAEE
jgi:small subunit ribosomal protein S16